MLELRILTGLHRGAAFPLEGDIVRIGHGPDNDIILRDPGISAHACIFTRLDETTWQYRGCEPIQTGTGSTNAGESERSSVVAGARWFAGPVLIGCEEESAPWQAARVPENPPTNGGSSMKWAAPVSSRPTARVAVAAAVAVMAIAGLLTRFAVSSKPPAPMGATAEAPTTTIAAEPALAPLPLIKGIVYPAETSERPPFGLRSATGGPYGFVVTDNGRVLISGSRWQAYTLVRIEQGRAVFAGPHPAEITW
jgi:hypothetical protein